MEYELKFRNTEGELCVQVQINGIKSNSKELLQKIHELCSDYVDESNSKMFCVYMFDFGTQKINCIKIVREFTGLGLKESKDLVETAPAIIIQEMEAGRAKQLAAQLTQAGANVRACPEKLLVTG